MPHPLGTPLRIVMDIEADNGDKLLPKATPAQLHSGFGRAESIGALKAGTSGGRATVYLAGHLKDGTPVILETTLRLLTQAVNVLNARHGG